MYTNEKNWRFPFFTIWIGQVFSQLSSSIVQMVIIWYLIAHTNSPTIVAVAGITGFLPQGILGIFIGVFIDRYNRKLIMIISDVTVAIASLILVFVGMLGEIPIWIIFIILFIRSVGTAFHTPSLQAVTPLIVPKEMLSKCMGYSQTLQSISLLVSPAAAAALFTTWDFNYIILFDVVGALIAVFTLSLVKVPNLKVNNIVVPHVWKEAKNGLLTLKQHNLLEFMLLGTLFNVVYMPIYVLFPMMPISYFGKTAWHAGVVEILFAGGMLIGAILLGKWAKSENKIILMALSILGIGNCLLLSGILPSNAFIIFSMLSTLLGVFSPFFTGIQTVILQQKIEPEYLGRVMSLLGSLIALTTSIGIMISGFVSEIIGIEKVFVVSGIIIVGISILYVIIPSVKNIERS